jgi:hypothetical protein
MPIRLNLLAEAQAAEDSRRRDPVKRAIWVAALLVSLMLVWSSSLQLKAMMVSREVSKSENLMKSFTNDFQQVIQNQNKTADVRNKLNKLQQLAADRFLQANTLNALQQSIVEDVQLIHFRSEQSYVYTDAVKPRTNDTRVIAGRAATATEKVVVSLEGSDSSSNPGDQVLKYKEALTTNDYFKKVTTGKQNSIALKSLSPPDTSANGRRSVFFTLECRLPEITR